MVVEAENVPAEQFVYQLDKLVNIIDVTDLTETRSVIRELALIKVKADSQTRGEVMQLVEVFRAKIVDVNLHSLVIEVSGPEDRVQSLISLLESFGILEIVRTGRVAMSRGPGLSNHGHRSNDRVLGQPALVESAVA
jgi:acetolactate synthase-1/3 small subunit